MRALSRATLLLASVAAHEVVTDTFWDPVCDGVNVTTDAVFRVDMGVDELDLDVDGGTMTLNVKFGFTPPQLTDSVSAEA